MPPVKEVSTIRVVDHTQKQFRKGHQGKDRCMDNVKDTGPQESVLLDVSKLTEAMEEVTKGGKKSFEGLYLSNGDRLDTKGEVQQTAPTAIKDEGAQKDIAMQRVVRIHNAQGKKRAARATRKRQSDDEIADEESARAVKPILAGASETEQMLWQDLFNFFDVDKDRTWGTIEFAQRMSDIGNATTVEEASNYLYFAGVRDVDRITYNDFVQLMPKLKAYRTLIEKDAALAFATQDPGTGFVSPQQLRKVLIVIGGSGGIDPEQCEYIVRKSDRLKNGRISFEFFIRAMFEDSMPITTYVSPKRRHPIVAAIVRAFSCGGTAPPHDDFDDQI